MGDLSEDIKRRLVPIDTGSIESIRSRLIPYDSGANEPSISSSTRPKIEDTTEIQVKPADRWKVKRASDDSGAQARMLNAMGYPNVEIRSGDRVFVNGAPLDPEGMFNNWREPVQELAENYDVPLGMMRANPVTGAAKELGIAGLDEYLRNDLDPEADGASYSRLALRTALGAGGGKLDDLQAAKQLKNATRAQDLKNLANQGVGKAKGMSDNIAGTVKPIAAKLAQDAKDEFLSETRKLQGVANELGVNVATLKTFGQEPITTNIKYLTENSPEFVQLVLKQPFKNNRLKNVSDLYEKTGLKIRNFYENSDEVVPVSDFFDTEAYKKLVNNMYDTKSTQKAAELRSLHDTYIRDLANHTLTSHAIRNTPDLAERAAKQGVEVNQILSELVQDSFSKNADGTYALDIKDIIEVLKNKNTKINIGDLWNFRKAADDAAQYGTKIQDTDHKILGMRSIAQASRDALSNTIAKSDQPEMLKEIALFNNLVPVVKAIDNSAASGALQKLNLKANLYVSAIGGTFYRGLGYAEKIANSAVTKALGRDFAEKGARALKGAKTMAGQGVELFSAGKEKLAGLPGMPDMSSVSRGFRQEMGRLGANQLTEPNDTGAAFDPNSFLELQNQTPQKLPRDPQLIAKSPQLAEQLATVLSPDTGLLFSDAVKSGDPIKMRMATVAAMQEAPELFEDSITGMRSEVAVDGRMIISSPQEAEMYKKTLMYQYNSGKIDANFYAKQRSALNDPTDMEVYPVPGVTTKSPLNPAPEATEKLGSLNRLNNVSKRITTSAGERRSYDY